MNRAETADVVREGPLAQWLAHWRAWTGAANLLAALDARRETVVGPAVGAVGAWLAAGVHQSRSSWGVIICHDPERLDAWVDDLALFGVRNVCLFPALETSPQDRSRLDEMWPQRLTTLRQLLEGDATPSLVVTSAAALLQPVPAPEALREAMLELRSGQTYAMESLIQWLTARGFQPMPSVALPGEFAVRGGIMDVFPLDAAQPIRLEWFDDTIDSMRRFDVETQRSVERIESLAMMAWEKETGSDSSLMAYLPENAWLYSEDLGRIADVWESLRRETEGSPEWLPPEQLGKELTRFACIDALPLGALPPGAQRLPVESVERFTGEIGRVQKELEIAAAGCHVWLLAETDAERERLGELLADSPVAESGRLHLTVGRISGGFRLKEAGALVLSSAEMFRRSQVRRTPRRHYGRPIDEYLRLERGELVVHLAHGIARYHGLEVVEKEGFREEHLVLEFRGGTRLLVPASQIGLVQKYVGGTKKRPMLSTLGGRQWSRQKTAAAAAVEDLAAEMLQLQAERLLRSGIAFDPDSEWQREFDASFPYTETDDQLRAMQEIKSDMEAPRPMDRLLCGDVGFGKTELAMRAAFKAVESGYQVAVLVPTTILAEQHYHSFRERMAEFPIDVARLSRFCTTRETREILEGLEAGRIDIVIGTHRLASPDVKFHNLGLVIIDEEQRFGVAVKERLKSLQSTVDILTMTATPIPRTLHMALVGVRDISTLQTAPEDRVAVETRVIGFDESLIRQAVLRELHRGGQVYFVHNRIEDIHLVAAQLQRIVPEARLGIGHGRLPEHELEQVMVDFVDHRYDVLLATTIVESGLDIPSANTIFIDEADRYGLADLHQLRGRVGRYKHRAFCYLIVDPSKRLTPNAAKRLHAIEEYSELGAGFHLAMRDLEIRGAGNLLGTQQSGHIAAVGYELYCEMLEAAVRRLKRQPPKKRLEVDIRLPGDAYLPDYYVQDWQLKMELYRRMAGLQDVEAIHAFRAELMDRFGLLPDPVERLLTLAEMRIDAAIWQIEAIWVEEKKYLGMRFGDRGRIETLVKRHGSMLRIVDDRSVYATIPKRIDTDEELWSWVKSVLQPQ